MDIELYSTVASVPSNDWDELIGPEDPPFSAHAFLRDLETSGCATPETGWLPQFLMARSSDGEAVGALPLYLKNHSNGEYIFDHGWADAAHRAGLAYYPKLIACTPFTPAVGRRFLIRQDVDQALVRRALAQAAEGVAQARGATGVHLLFLSPEEQDTLSAEGFLPRHTLQFQWRNAGYPTFESYLATLKSKRRAQIIRERRESVGSSIRIRVVSGLEATDAERDAIWRFYQNTNAQYVWQTQYLNRPFFERVFESHVKDVVLILAERDGEIIAGTFNMVKDGVFYGRYWGCTEEVRFLHFEVCLYAPIQYAIENKLKLVQAGAGGQHKIRRGYLPTIVRSCHQLYDDRLKDAVSRALEHEREYHRALVEEAQSWNRRSD